jgi:hypothetical protein
MVHRMIRSLVIPFAALSLLLAGCAGTVTNMREVPASQAMAAPEPGKALVVFMRPSGLGFGVQSSVFEIRNETPVLVGIVAAKTRVMQQVNPGRYLYMVIGENADFMTADVVAGRTYYVKVEPRMGMWKARFGLEPYRAKDLAGAEFTGALTECRAVEKGPESEAWAASNAASIASKRTEYYGDWMKQAESARLRLLPEDGK